ncbi:hypothetical protein [Vibrio crassostreae]|uniref:hypothetical protein n=1 Tax=Vibrio crassostreae TaxID=246167 RepID=UPI001B301800|nr:hypothetical protein [Vibrio crassostreae]
MTLAEIKAAVEAGKKVHWGNEAYTVIKDEVGQFLIICSINNDCVGLTWTDNTTLNGKEEDFFVA